MFLTIKTVIKAIYDFKCVNETRSSIMSFHLQQNTVSSISDVVVKS